MFVQVGSYIHDSTQIWFTGSFGHDIENQRAQQYELTAQELDINDTFIIHANRCVPLVFIVLALKGAQGEAISNLFLSVCL